MTSRCAAGNLETPFQPADLNEQDTTLKQQQSHLLVCEGQINDHSCAILKG